MSDYNANPRKIVTKTPDCVEVGECRPPHRTSKNTRHLCKGRAGIPHAWEWRRQRDDLERERRMSLTYNRITEVPICFGCEKVDHRRRHYCNQCGEPWPELRYARTDGRRRYLDWLPCIRCGAVWMIRHKPGYQWSPSGAVVR
jgi:ferredoxin-like protein FixX